METRKLASIIVSAFNALIQCLEEGVEMINKELAKSDDDAPASAKSGKSSGRSKTKDDDDDEKPTARRGKAKKEEEDDDEDASEEKEEEEDETNEGDEPSEEDCVDAARAALKVLDRADVSKIIKKYGKADKASEVKPELRQKVIDALEKATDEV